MHVLRVPCGGCGLVNLPRTQFLPSRFSIPITGSCTWQSSGCTAGGRGMLCVLGVLLLWPVKDCLGSLKWCQQDSDCFRKTEFGPVSAQQRCSSATVQPCRLMTVSCSRRRWLFFHSQLVLAQCWGWQRRWSSKRWRVKLSAFISGKKVKGFSPFWSRWESGERRSLLPFDIGRGVCGVGCLCAAVQCSPVTSGVALPSWGPVALSYSLRFLDFCTVLLPVTLLFDSWVRRPLKTAMQQTRGPLLKPCAGISHSSPSKHELINLRTAVGA